MLTDNQAAALFQAFATQRELFALKPAVYRKAAIDVLASQLKEKGCDLEMARRIVGAVGNQPVLAVLDEMQSPAIVALVKKLDKANGARAADEPSWARAHLAALVERRIEPASPKVKPTRTTTKKAKASVVRALHQARSMGGG